MTAKSNAERQRACRERRGRYVTDFCSMLLEIKDILLSLRHEIVTLRHEIKENPPHPHKKTTSLNSENPESKTPGSSGRKATRLSTDWIPSIVDRDYAVAKGLDPDKVFEKFRNHWLAKSGKDACSLDWSARWRNWCITDAERLPNHVNGHKLSAVDNLYLGAAMAAESYEARKRTRESSDEPLLDV